MDQYFYRRCFTIYEVIEFKSLQLAADDSLRSKNLNNLQAKADDYINNDFNGIVQLQADARENFKQMIENLQIG